MRLALVTSWLSAEGGGVSGAVLSLFKELRDRPAIDVRVLGFGYKTPANLGLIKGSEKCIALYQPYRIPKFPIAPRLASDLISDSFDIVHTHGLWAYSSFATKTWHEQTSRPYVVSPHGMLDDWALRNRRWTKLLARKLFEDKYLDACSCFHALTPEEAIAIRKAGFRAPIAIVPNGVALPSSPASIPTGMWPQFGNRKILLFLGRIHPKKGVRETIEAWNLLGLKVPAITQEWLLVVAGWDDGGHAAVLERRIGELGIGGSVFLAGPVFGERKEALFSQSSAFILASHSEGQPVSVLEAWSYGLPVFMTRACNLPEGFSSGAAVEISSDPTGIAETLASHLGGRELKMLGRSGRTLVKRQFSWEQSAAKLSNVYHWLMRRASRPDCVELA